MTDGPYPFSGKIIEAYYTNPQLDSVCVLWSDGKVAREYHIGVDEEDHQFKALLSEFSWDDIDECTRKVNEAARQEFKNAFDRYAKENEYEVTFVYAHSLDILFKFDADDAVHKEELFKLKLAMFDTPLLKESRKKTSKTKLRKSSTPLEAIEIYKEFMK